ncbi:MAG: hypothetical protein A2V83_10165 [Nitrospirae bacterium RBG_16_64_22]|nr:MAG: hypothetical protein A2V83_10165 [Nitrospirae bacterium RBG_16_64_22]
MSVMDDLQRDLLDPDPDVRRDAMLKAAGISDRSGMEILLRGLHDLEWRVRKTAVDVICQRAGEDVVKDLAAILESEENAGARNSAVEALVRIGPASVPILLDRLPRSEGDVRKFIVDILGDIRDRRAADGLVSLLKDADENVRYSAIEALGRLGDPSVAPALIEILGSGNVWLAYPAAEALGHLGDARAVEPLIAALGERILREAGFRALGRLGDARAFPSLIEGLWDGNASIRHAALKALSGLADLVDLKKGVLSLSVEARDRAGESLIRILAEDSEARQPALRMLLVLREPRAIEALVSLLPDASVEDDLVSALAAFGPAAVPPLLRSLTDDNDQVRRAAARALGAGGDRTAVPPLMERLKDGNGHVRQQAARALGRIGDASTVSGIMPLLGDPFPDVQDAAVEALSTLLSPDDVAVLDAELSSSLPVRRRNAVAVLGQVGGPGAGPRIVFALKDEKRDVRRAAVESLALLSGEDFPDKFSSLLRALTDEDGEVRLLAARAIGRGVEKDEDRRSAAAGLESLLTDEDIWVRAAAARGLGWVGTPEALDALAGLFRRGGTEEPVIMAAIEAFGERTDARLPSLVIPLLSTPDPEVRKAALSALSPFPWEQVGEAVYAALADPSWSVRRAAVGLVAGSGLPAAEVRRRLDPIAQGDPDDLVRDEARRVIAEPGGTRESAP